MNEPVGGVGRRRGWLTGLRRSLYGLMLWASQPLLAAEPQAGHFVHPPAKISVAIESPVPGSDTTSHYRVEINRDAPRLTSELPHFGAWLRRQSWDLSEDDLRTARKLRGGLRVDVPLDDASQLYLNFIPGNRERREGLRWQPLTGEATTGGPLLWSAGCLMHTRGRIAGREMNEEQQAELGFTPQLSINLDGRRQAAPGTRQLTLQHGDWVDHGNGLVQAENAWQVQLRWKF